jgi:hypothetical protein
MININNIKSHLTYEQVTLPELEGMTMRKSFPEMQGQRLSKAEAYPKHWDILSDSDQMEYRQLKKFIDPLSLRTTKEDLKLKFRILLTEIQRYTTRNDCDDWKRQFVCGILSLTDIVVISTRQLSILIGKCKSSINCGFQALGYQTIPMSSNVASMLAQTFPFLMKDCSGVRQWTVRAQSVCPSIQSTIGPSQDVSNDSHTFSMPQKPLSITEMSDSIHSWMNTSDFPLDQEKSSWDETFSDVLIPFY